ncbi:sialate O-acetylesterase [Planctomycetes bacterium Poly30]|uniref:sialate O-acetylesterase n=1 Tax=Saltatorellus ferox TaxID=2528018 RepID=UPI0011A71C97
MLDSRWTREAHLPWTHGVRLLLLLAGGWLTLSASSALAMGMAMTQGASGPLKVFVLAGQSNMQGHAKVSTLRGMAGDPETLPLLGKLVGDDGEARVFEDVWISSLGCGSAEDVERTGQLTAGFGAEAGGPKIGPELSFGMAMEEALDEPILIIKTAWGGKSLHSDFRPPSAGPSASSQDEQATGKYYRLMIEHVRKVLADIERVYPGYDAERGFELAGFVWFQGWNDMVDQGAYPRRAEPGGYDAYSRVLTHFIRDVRRDLAAPELPFVIGVLGVGGATSLYGPEQQRYLAIHQNFRDAMAAPASLDEFEGTVSAVLTERFWDHEAADLRARRATLTPEEIEVLESRVSNAEYHYLGSAKILTRIGQAFAEAQIEASIRAKPVPAWIWFEATETHQQVLLRRSFEVASVPDAAVLTAVGDDDMIVLVNGERVGEHGRAGEVVARDIAGFLRAGENRIEVRVQNVEGPAGLALRLDLGGAQTLVTDGAWDATLAQRALRGRWSKATVLGLVGDDGLPWSERVTLRRFDEPDGELSVEEPPGVPQQVQRASALQVPDGFEAELLYTVPSELFGSWVALATDDQGRFYTSDQAGRGLFRITPAAIGDPNARTSIEKVEVDVSGAQGMCWAFDSLYVNVNGQGVWRITDTDGDDQLDRAEHLIKLGNGGEHGPHALLPTEDGEGLYFLAGNHVRPPAYEGSMAPDNWGEDLLLTRLWDPGGHAWGMTAPGGWIARCRPDGTEVTIISTGYRNQYDIAMNAEGEMFTYDADMEWDLGSPWYRPTRVCHVTSGSEFGWRSGTGKWPSYYEDSLPPVLEIGPGSPTGMVFGTGAKFPARFQRALFLLDWTFGTIYAVHLEPDGASYRATKEDFVWSKPLGVTDAAVGADGALYFTVGGRGSQSALYRVRYVGSESTAPVALAASDPGTEARTLRRSMEAFHGRVDSGAIEAAWPLLSHADRFVRFAARVAVENQPVETWRERALTEENPQAAVMGLMALARQGSASDLPAMISALDRLELERVDDAVLLAALRAYALAFARLVPPGELDEEIRLQVLARLEPHFPSGRSLIGHTGNRSGHAVDAELARLLTYLRSETVVARTLALMESAAPLELPGWARIIQRNDAYGGPIARMLDDMPPVQNIEYALILMDATEGWTLPLREQYFSFFAEASQHPGGLSYAAFLGKIRETAAAHLAPRELRSLAPLLGQSLLAPPPENVTPPEGPGREWTLPDAVAEVGSKLRGRSFDRGQNLFHAVSCSQCHRLDGSGGAIGPDLTTVANKFGVPDILEAIVEPSRVISDQYGSHIVLDTDGNMAEGILVDGGDELTLYSRDPNEGPLVYARSEIAKIQESPVSQMPTGLIDPLNPEELKDLIAFLVSGGNPEDAVFSASEGADGRR